MDGYGLLATAIVRQAVDDFDKLIRRVPKKQLCIEEVCRRKSELNKLIRFFKSPWCGALLSKNVNQEALVKGLLRKYRNSKFAMQAKVLESDKELRR